MEQVQCIVDLYLPKFPTATNLRITLTALTTASPTVNNLNIYTQECIIASLSLSETGYDSSSDFADLTKLPPNSRRSRHFLLLPCQRGVRNSQPLLFSHSERQSHLSNHSPSSLALIPSIYTANPIQDQVVGGSNCHKLTVFHCNSDCQLDSRRDRACQ